jgi:hypothetical protein
MLNFARPLASAPARARKPAAVSAANFDRDAVLMDLDRHGIDAMTLVDWLGTMKQEAFWPVEEGSLIEPQYNASQRIYLATVWREHGHDDVGDTPGLLEHFYTRFAPLFFLHRRKTAITGSHSGWGPDREGCTVEFNEVMDKALLWIALQLPQLVVLHELDSDAYVDAPADLVSVRAIAAGVGRAAFYGKATTELTPWICAWLQFQIRYHVHKFCEGENLQPASN